MRNKLIEAAAPGQPFVGGAFRKVELGVGAALAQLFHKVLGAEILFRAAAQEEIVELLVEILVVEDAVVSSLCVQTEDCAAESACI